MGYDGPITLEPHVDFSPDATRRCKEAAEGMPAAELHGLDPSALNAAVDNIAHFREQISFRQGQQKDLAKVRAEFESEPWRRLLKQLR